MDVDKNSFQEAMEHNDSNEVAVTFDLNSDLNHMQYSVTYGTEEIRQQRYFHQII